MNLRPGEVRGLAFVSGRHPRETLTVSIALDNGTPWLCAWVYTSDKPEPTRAQYVISEDGAVWESVDGTQRTVLLRESISEKSLGHGKGKRR